MSVSRYNFAAGILFAAHIRTCLLRKSVRLKLLNLRTGQKVELQLPCPSIFLRHAARNDFFLHAMYFEVGSWRLSIYKGTSKNHVTDAYSNFTIPLIFNTSSTDGMNVFTFNRKYYVVKNSAAALDLAGILKLAAPSSRGLAQAIYCRRDIKS